ncbi:MAG TPA: hypothetical protein PLP33_24965 [Leptospiraceae bacterium]|nr:hypothetical protein [Leptospiraceae bacterium]
MNSKNQRNFIDFPSLNVSVSSHLNPDGTYTVESNGGRGTDTGKIKTETELTHKQFNNYLERLGAREALAKSRKYGEV